MVVRSTVLAFEAVVPLLKRDGCSHAASLICPLRVTTAIAFTS